ncbi:hypothetical protein PTKIN_Ptkin06aG0151600 [Pterospermum kingtungense]
MAAASMSQSEASITESNTDFPMLNRYSMHDLEAFTDNFNTNNLIGITQFGKLYRGKIVETGKETRTVTIKIFKELDDCFLYHEINVLLNEELKVLTLPSMRTHPNLVKLIGYCREEQMKAVIYDLNPMDTLHNIMTKDYFGWIRRIKVALTLARLLKFLHSKENSYLVQNVDTAHILLDQDYNPFIVDFGLMSGGIIGKMSVAKHSTPMTPGYCDMFGASSGLWNKYSDVYSYGVILIELITKRITEEVDIRKGRVEWTDLWALDIIKSGKSIDVHKSLQEEPLYEGYDGWFLVKLGLRWIEFNPERRPSSSGIVRVLEHLLVVRNHGNEIGL